MEFLTFLFGRNFRTSISGLMLAIGSAGGLVSDVPQRFKWIFGILAFVGGAGLGFTAKDAKVSSTFAQVEEATKEEEAKTKDPIGTER